jgi:hypothetical protein
MAKDITPPKQPKPEQSNVVPIHSEPAKRRLLVEALAKVIPRRTQWVVKGKIVRKNLNLVAGVGGLGKSTYAMHLAAELSTGRLTGKPEATIVISSEDTAEEVLRPRLEAAGGNLNLVHWVHVSLDEGGLVVLPGDLVELERVAKETKAALIIIDPIVAVLSEDVDSHHDSDVRRVLGPLMRLADDCELAIVMVAHLNKAPSTEAYLRISGSTAFYNACRSCLLITQDPEDEDARFVSQHKSNYARIAPVERWKIESCFATTTDHGGHLIPTSRMVFVEEVDLDPAELLTPKRAPSKGDRAETFLKGALTIGEWRERAPIVELGEAMGFSEATLKRAFTDIGGESRRLSEPHARTVWALPDVNGGFPLWPPDTQPAQPSPPTNELSEVTRNQAESEPFSVHSAQMLEEREAELAGGDTCVVCDRPFDPDDAGATATRCPTCAGKAAGPRKAE